MIKELTIFKRRIRKVFRGAHKLRPAESLTIARHVSELLPERFGGTVVCASFASVVCLGGSSMRPAAFIRTESLLAGTERSSG